MQKWKKEEATWMSIENKSLVSLKKDEEEKQRLMQTINVENSPLVERHSIEKGNTDEMVKKMTLQIDYLIGALRNVAATSVEAEGKASEAVSVYKDSAFHG